MSLERKSVSQLAFGHYLRTGERLTAEEWLLREERKFNPYHDEIGRFTSPPGVTVSYGRSGSRQAARSRQRPGSPRPSPALRPVAPAAASRATPRKADTTPDRSRAEAFLDESRRAWRGSDGVSDDDRWEQWASRPAPSDLFGTKPPEVVERIRRMNWNLKSPDGDRIMKFADVEKHLMDKSTEFWASNVFPPYVREHAIFVYQSETRPGVFTARIVAGKGATGMGQLDDFTTGKPLEMRRLPQLAGYRLIMVEHTHPVATTGTFIRGHPAPSNADMYIAAENPGVAFVVNQLAAEGTSASERRTISFYFGF